MSIDRKDVFLAQGTLRPDLSESASATVSSHADDIKTHHNNSPMARKYREDSRFQALDSRFACFARTTSSSKKKKQHDRLEKLTKDAKLYTSILPIRSVGVQGVCRSYLQIVFLAKLIPRICHTINRVCYLMGTPIRDSHFPNDTTPTTLSDYALSQLRECDHRANSILKKHSQVEKLSQMPVVLLPLHFDKFRSQFYFKNLFILFVN
ncbi:unnamed protein product [Oikopleura dioica]|uniref:Uncharacterized protein n=1 Tax=Oikopleura dioica TaxID=34765 RepID=E4X5V9_OIKDI|nr:unnamed protein product [Oikopleura dioica]